jgi:hypothetical protein
VLFVNAAAGLGYAIGARAAILRTPLIYLLGLGLLPLFSLMDNSGLGGRFLSGDARATVEDAATAAASAAGSASPEA